MPHDVPGLSADHPHHDHRRTRSLGNERALLWALGINASYLGVEAAAGWWTGSLALLSDAAHMLSDVAALTIAFVATRLANLDAAPDRTFGLRRAEPVGAFINAFGLMFACLFIFAEATQRLLSEPPAIAAGPVLVVAVIGLLVNLGSAWMLARGDTDNLNIRGALLHMLADALGSVGAIVAAIMVMYDMAWADPAVSLVIGVLVLFSAGKLLRDSGRVLLEMAPPTIDVAAVADALRGLDGVQDVHDLHVWSLDGAYTLITAHIVVIDQRPTEPVRLAAEQLLEQRFGVEHHTLQLERDKRCPEIAPA